MNEKKLLKNSESFTNVYSPIWAYTVSEQDERSDYSYFEFKILQDTSGNSFDIGNILVKGPTFPKIGIGQVC